MHHPPRARGLSANTRYPAPLSTAWLWMAATLTAALCCCTPPTQPSSPIEPDGEGPHEIAAPASDPSAFELSLPSAVSRRWIGPAVFANRLQDWRIADGQLICDDGRNNSPLRTLMVLTHDLATDGPVDFTVRCAAAMPSQPEPDQPTAAPHREGAAALTPLPDPARGFRGLLLGAGGAHVTPRLSAMVHHRPALDGGLLVVVNEQGSLALFDNGVPASAGGSWSLGGPLHDGELPRLAAARATLPVDPAAAIDLQIRVGPADSEGRSQLHMVARTTEGEPVCELTTRVLRASLDGAFGLVSHLGPTSDAQDRGGWSFGALTARGSGLRSHPERAFGPIIASHFTVGEHGLTLTAQLHPLAPDKLHELVLRTANEQGQWDERALATLQPDSWIARFVISDWDRSRETPYEIVARYAGAYDQTEVQLYAGSVPAEPDHTQPFVIASLNCQKIYTGGLRWNSDGLWFPHAEVARDVSAHDPDLLFFAGDQIYEGDLDPVDDRDEDTLILDYLYKYTRHCWSFGELTRRIPSVVIPDDHDVYHGNLWGAGGRAAVADKARGLSAQDSGGYKYGPRFVNVVHATQTSHLPPPTISATVEQGISVYTTQLDWGGVSFAVLADRQWKSSATPLVPDGRVVNGWFQAPGFDPRDADVPGAVLLGEQQLDFLERWADDWGGDTWMKVALSQTPFVNVASIPDKSLSGGVLPSLPIPEQDAYPEGYKFAADTDSGGWPQSGRDRALRRMRKAFAIHLAGDQHLGSLVEYGVDQHRDSGFAFTSPAVANTWPRRWWPPIHGANPEPDAPHYTGDFEDGFGNLMTVWAVANPVRSGREPRALFDRMPGYGIVRLNPLTRTIDLECWPRDVAPLADDAWQYAGWPRRIHQLDNHAEPLGHLAQLEVPGQPTPVVRLIDETTCETVYTLRAPAGEFCPPVFGAGPFTVEFGEPDTEAWWRTEGLWPTEDRLARITPPQETPGGP